MCLENYGVLFLKKKEPEQDCEHERKHPSTAEAATNLRKRESYGETEKDKRHSSTYVISDKYAQIIKTFPSGFP